MKHMNVCTFFEEYKFGDILVVKDKDGGEQRIAVTAWVASELNKQTKPVTLQSEPLTIVKIIRKGEVIWSV